MEKALQLQSKQAAWILVTILTAMMLFAVAYLQTQHRTTPISIQQAIELQWSADSTWTKNWDM